MGIGFLACGSGLRCGDCVAFATLTPAWIFRDRKGQSGMTSGVKNGTDLENGFRHSDERFQLPLE